MKCPKCNYLGFETGDRCRNCGYDFSLIDHSPPDDADLDLTLSVPVTAHAPTTTPEWTDAVDRALGTAMTPEALAPEPLPVPPTPVALPLYEADDAPLIKLPATPRPPLAVRRTPDTPRLRAVPKPAPRVRSAEPALQFAEIEEEAPAPVAERAPVRAVNFSGAAPGPAGARLAAAALDHLILAGIDIAVVYLTLRMAQLDITGWTLLPLAPLATFLVLLKVAYFCAFTAIGGQTIGKMAMGLRVVTDEGGAVDGACAIRRTLAGTVSTVVLGLGFLPALVGPGGRALHDHLAHTRVVDLHSA
ncbi:MAG: RDD family protein [Acidimicrobiia bacterium]|nr:RDD family protein [Acidimicrobiia bacterium]